MNNAPTILCDNFILRKPISEDKEVRFKIGRSKEFVKMCGGSIENFVAMTKEDAENWFNNLINHPCGWVIEKDGKMIGIARLTIKENQNEGRYSIGLFHESVYNQGIGTKVTKAVIDYAFKTLLLKKVDLVVLEYNFRAIRCYEKCGFIKEAIIKDNVEIDGIMYSDIIMSIINK